MGVPKSVVKLKKDGVEYVSNCDRVQYTLRELIRAALRDTGKLVCKHTKDSVKASGVKKITGKALKSVQYWVKWKQKIPNMQVGIKPSGFYLGYYELGTSKHRRYEFLKKATQNSIPELIKIQSQYLSALEDEARALSLIEEDDMQGSDEA